MLVHTEATPPADVSARQVALSSYCVHGPPGAKAAL